MVKVGAFLAVREECRADECDLIAFDGWEYFLERDVQLVDFCFAVYLVRWRCNQVNDCLFLYRRLVFCFCRFCSLFRFSFCRSRGRRRDTCIRHHQSICFFIFFTLFVALFFALFSVIVVVILVLHNIDINVYVCVFFFFSILAIFRVAAIFFIVCFITFGNFFKHFLNRVAFL